MTSCAHTRDLIDDALDGRLDARARSDFDAHVRQCGACAAEWELATSLRSSLLKVGLDPAPAGLRESIAAQVRTLGDRKTAPTNYGAGRTGTGWFRSPAFLRSAAGILVIVAIGWVAMRSMTKDRWVERSPTRDDSPAASNERTVAKANAPAAITVAPAGEAAGLAREEEAGLAFGDARSAEAMDKARAIALGGEVPPEALDRDGATPERRVLQAETLVWLEQNLGAILDRAGDTPALRQMAKDADDALMVFAGRAKDGGEKKLDEKAENDVSALKVTEARRAEAARRAGARRDQDTAEAASYTVTGPGVIARVERVFADRGIRFDPVWLKDQDPNPRKRTMDQAATDYRIVEVEVSEAVLNQVVGDLESLDGVRLAPVSGGERARAQAGESALAKRPAADLQGSRGGENAPGRGAAGGAGGASTQSTPAAPMAAAAQSKLLGMRKLRLVLISR